MAPCLSLFLPLSLSLIYNQEQTIWGCNFDCICCKSTLMKLYKQVSVVVVRLGWRESGHGRGERRGRGGSRCSINICAGANAICMFWKLNWIAIPQIKFNFWSYFSGSQSIRFVSLRFYSIPNFIRHFHTRICCCCCCCYCWADIIISIFGEMANSANCN